jgi:hypothetical protein
MYPFYFCYLYLTIVVKPLNVIRMWMLLLGQAKLLDHLKIHQIVATTSINDCMYMAALTYPPSAVAMIAHLLGQSCCIWPNPWQRWHLMSEVRPVEVGTIAFAATLVGVWDLLLSCPFDFEGALLRTTSVEGSVAARTLEEGTALAGAGSCRGVKVLFRRCCW